MIELDLTLPLAALTLEVSARFTSGAVAVLGPSGSGKTSLLEAIAGLRPRARGRVALGGRVLLDTAAGIRLPPERRRVGYVPQDSLLFPHLTARDNVRFGLRPEAGTGGFDGAVELLGIGALLERYPATLSGGERQRVALARALCTSPELLLLDEPLAALDVELKERILPYLLRIRDEARVPLLYVTHHPGEARLLAREALLLEGGRVKAQGPAQELLGPALGRSLAAGEAWENVVDGVLEPPSRERSGWALRLQGGLRLWVPGGQGALVGGERAAYAVLAEDILLSTGPLQGLSARNVFQARVEAVDPVGEDVVVRLDAGGAGWHARVTAAAAEELGLSPGLMVYMAIKTHSFRRL